VLAAAAAVWRRPIVALYLFIAGLALHNSSWRCSRRRPRRCRARRRSGMEGDCAGRRRRASGHGCDRERRLPFRPRTVDRLALAFAAVVCLYAVIPNVRFDGDAGAEAILTPSPRARAGRRLLWPLARRDGTSCADRLRCPAAGALAVCGLVDLTVDVEVARSGASSTYRDELGFDYHGPGGLPDNWAFNTEDGLFGARRQLRQPAGVGVRLRRRPVAGRRRGSRSATA
jgi:hypothetical protein